MYQISNVSSCAGCTSGPINISSFIGVNYSTTFTPGLLVDIGINVGSVPGFLSYPTASAIPGFVDRVPPGDIIGWNFNSGAPGEVALTPGTTSIILASVIVANSMKP